jgi:hypothetical protein
MSENNWWQLYLAAVVEIDRNKLRDRVKAAEDAIRVRASLVGQVSSEERIATRRYGCFACLEARVGAQPG